MQNRITDDKWPSVIDTFPIFPIIYSVGMSIKPLWGVLSDFGVASEGLWTECTIVSEYDHIKKNLYG